MAKASASPVLERMIEQAPRGGVVPIAGASTGAVVVFLRFLYAASVRFVLVGNRTYARDHAKGKLTCAAVWWRAGGRRRRRRSGRRRRWRSTGRR